MKSNLFVLGVFFFCFSVLSSVSFVQMSFAQEAQVKRESVETTQYQIPQGSESYMTGLELQTYCASGYDTDVGLCAGYVTGVADLMFEHNLYGLSACHNEHIRSQQLVDLVRIYMKKHPEDLGGNARFVVAQALSSGYPCY